jgi:hypothetical protein
MFLIVEGYKLTLDSEDLSRASRPGELAIALSTFSSGASQAVDTIRILNHWAVLF